MSSTTKSKKISHCNATYITTTMSTFNVIELSFSAFPKFFNLNFAQAIKTN